MLIPTAVTAATALAAELMGSCVSSRHFPAWDRVPDAVRVESGDAYVNCVNPEDGSFDYGCQQVEQQVIVRGGRPFVLRQSWGSKSTGAAVWPSSIVLSHLLEEKGENWFRGKDVLEVGAGLGLNAFTAESLGAKSVTLTDGDDDVIQLAGANARDNFRRVPRNLQLQKFQFGGDRQGLGLRPSYDIILASDVTYNRESWDPFIATIKDLSSPRTTVLYSTTPRFRDEWEVLQARFREQGFRVRELVVEPASFKLDSDIHVMEITRIEMEDRALPAVALASETR